MYRHTVRDADPPTPLPDDLPEPGPGGPGVPGDERPRVIIGRPCATCNDEGDCAECGTYINLPRYTRDVAFDKHVLFGDDYPADAWRDQFGLLRWVAIGVDPNRP